VEINNLAKNQVITSYNFARLSDIVYSESVTVEQYEKLKNDIAAEKGKKEADQRKKLLKQWENEKSQIDQERNLVQYFSENKTKLESVEYDKFKYELTKVYLPTVNRFKNTKDDYGFEIDKLESFKKEIEKYKDSLETYTTKKPMLPIILKKDGKKILTIIK